MVNSPKFKQFRTPGAGGPCHRRYERGTATRSEFAMLTLQTNDAGRTLRSEPPAAPSNRLGQRSTHTCLTPGADQPSLACCHRSLTAVIHKSRVLPLSRLLVLRLIRPTSVVLCYIQHTNHLHVLGTLHCSDSRSGRHRSGAHNTLHGLNNLLRLHNGGCLQLICICRWHILAAQPHHLCADMHGTLSCLGGQRGLPCTPSQEEHVGTDSPCMQRWVLPELQPPLIHGLRLMHARIFQSLLSMSVCQWRPDVGTGGTRKEGMLFQALWGMWELHRTSWLQARRHACIHIPALGKRGDRLIRGLEAQAKRRALFPALWGVQGKRGQGSAPGGPARRRASR